MFGSCERCAKVLAGLNRLPEHCTQPGTNIEELYLGIYLGTYLGIIFGESFRNILKRESQSPEIAAACQSLATKECSEAANMRIFQKWISQSSAEGSRTDVHCAWGSRSERKIKMRQVFASSFFVLPFLLCPLTPSAVRLGNLVGYPKFGLQTS